MNERIGFSLIFIFLIIIQSVCVVLARRSSRSIGSSVAMLCCSLILPVTGNLVIIASTNRILSLTGYYIYMLGMDMVLFALIRFTDRYCQGIGDGTQKPTVVYAALEIDCVQLLLNIVFKHAFEVERITVENAPYYRLVPHFGQTIHRIVDYGILGAVILIFILATVKTVRLYRERYIVLLVSIVTAGLWQAFYIISRTPIDRSIIGMNCVGLLVFYFSIYYRPLKLLDRMLSDIASNMGDALFVYDQMGRCIWANKHALDMLGLTDKELERVSDGLKSYFGEREFIQADRIEKRTVGSGDDERHYIINNRAFVADSKHIAGAFLSIHDNTEEERRLKRELYSSSHDSLTGLYTKQYLYYRIRKLLDNDAETEYLALFLDVKNFKIVNDVFGTKFGDLALKQIADVLKAYDSEKYLYGRLAGDTFGIFLPASQFDAERVEKELAAFIVTDGTIEHNLLIHIGVYEVSERSTDISVMFDRAHLSLSRITDEYKTRIVYYDSNVRENVLWGQRISAQLGEALETMQIRPYLQPITDRSGRVIGAEALARWVHPEKGYMSPSLFIPTFEKNGMIVEVDRHIWRCACKILSEWQGVCSDLFISVNISPKDFYFFDVVNEIRGLVREYGIEPSKLRIEITETVMMTDSAERMATLAELRRDGFIVEMDDFGSGYSSLNLLKEMPVDVLKIDMKFLSRSDELNRSNTILKNIIRLADDLDIMSLTEGVETEQQYKMLASMGCTLFQGYYFAKPMPVEEFEQYVAAQNV